MRVVALGADGVDLVDEHDRRRVLLSDAEQLANQLGSIAQVLLDELRTDDAQEGSARAVCHRLGQQGLAGAGLTVQDDSLRQGQQRQPLSWSKGRSDVGSSQPGSRAGTGEGALPSPNRGPGTIDARCRIAVSLACLWRLDADLLIKLGVRQGQLDGLLDLLDLLLQATHVRVRLQGGFLYLQTGASGAAASAAAADDDDDEDGQVGKCRGYWRLDATCLHNRDHGVCLVLQKPHNRIGLVV